MTPREKIETLRRMHAEATKGPWVVHPARAEIEAVSDQLPVCAMLWPTDERTEDQTYANASFIAEAHAALPALLDVAEAAAEVRRLTGEYDPDDPHIPTLHALEDAEKALDTALARLGEGERWS